MDNTRSILIIKKYCLWGLKVLLVHYVYQNITFTYLKYHDVVFIERCVLKSLYNTVRGMLDNSPPRHLAPKTARHQLKTARRNIKTTCSQYYCSYYDKIYNEHLIFALILHNAIYILQVLFQFLIDFNLKFNRLSKLSITGLLEQFDSNASIIIEGCMYSIKKINFSLLIIRLSQYKLMQIHIKCKCS